MNSVNLHRVTSSLLLGALLSLLPGLAQCQLAYDLCALGDMSTDCNYWGLQAFYDYREDEPRTIVAVGSNGVVYSSTTGLSWNQAQIGGTNYSFERVYHTGSRFIAVGENTSSTAETIWYSGDGVNWTEAVINSPCTTAAILYDVVQTGGRIIAVGGASTNTLPCVQISTDQGATWSAGSASAAGALSLYRVETDGTNYIAAGPYTGGTDVRVIVSTDGQDFASEPVAHPLSAGGSKGTNVIGTLEAFTLNGAPRIILAGEDETSSIGPQRTLYMNSGFTWTLDTTGVFASNMAQEAPRGLAYDNTTLVAVGDVCRVDTTTDATNLTWSGSASTMNGCSGVTWMQLVHFSGKFIAIGYDGSMNGKAAFSASGAASDWTVVNLGTSALKSVAFD